MGPTRAAGDSVAAAAAADDDDDDDDAMGAAFDGWGLGIVSGPMRMLPTQ
jgi:hypothetical protein